MYFGTRFFIRSLGTVTGSKDRLATSFKISGVFLFCLGLILLILFCVIEMLM